MASQNNQQEPNTRTPFDPQHRFRRSNTTMSCSSSSSSSSGDGVFVPTPTWSEDGSRPLSPETQKETASIMGTGVNLNASATEANRRQLRARMEEYLLREDRLEREGRERHNNRVPAHEPHLFWQPPEAYSGQGQGSHASLADHARRLRLAARPAGASAVPGAGPIAIPGAGPSAAAAATAPAVTSNAATNGNINPFTGFNSMPVAPHSFGGPAYPAKNGSVCPVNNRYTTQQCDYISSLPMRSFVTGSTEPGAAFELLSIDEVLRNAQNRAGASNAGLSTGLRPGLGAGPSIGTNTGPSIFTPRRNRAVPIRPCRPNPSTGRSRVGQSNASPSTRPTGPSSGSGPASALPPTPVTPQPAAQLATAAAAAVPNNTVSSSTPVTHTRSSNWDTESGTGAVIGAEDAAYIVECLAEHRAQDARRERRARRARFLDPPTVVAATAMYTAFFLVCVLLRGTCRALSSGPTSWWMSVEGVVAIMGLLFLFVFLTSYPAGYDCGESSDSNNDNEEVRRRRRGGHPGNPRQ